MSQNLFERGRDPFEAPTTDAARPKPPSGGPSVQQPPLSRAELADLRARAFDLALKLAAQMEFGVEMGFDAHKQNAKAILHYITDGK